MFYPLYINEEGTRIIKIGEPLAPTEDRRTVQPMKEQEFKALRQMVKRADGE
jgi:hypothetical protein